MRYEQWQIKALGGLVFPRLFQVLPLPQVLILSISLFYNKALTGWQICD